MKTTAQWPPFSIQCQARYLQFGLGRFHGSLLLPPGPL
jgi:hypothetical protein